MLKDMYICSFALGKTKTTYFEMEKTEYVLVSHTIQDWVWG